MDTMPGESRQAAAALIRVTEIPEAKKRARARATAMTMIIRSNSRYNCINVSWGN